MEVGGGGSVRECSVGDRYQASPLSDLLSRGAVGSGGRTEVAIRALKLLRPPDRCLLRPVTLRPGVLHSGSSDFESVDDLVEAVGELLQEVSGDSKDDAGIRAVCQRMYNTLRLYVPRNRGRWGRREAKGSETRSEERSRDPRAFPSTPNCAFYPRRAEPQSQGSSQVLLDAPIQLSKITENYGESEGKFN